MSGAGVRTRQGTATRGRGGCDLTALRRCRRAGLFQRMRAGEGVDLVDLVDDALDRRERRQVGFEVARSRCLSGEADVGDGDLIALAVAAGLARAGKNR